MAKHTIKGFVTYEKSRYDDAPRIDFMSYKPSLSLWPDMVIVSEHSIEVEVPDDFGPRPELIEALKAKQQEARAEFENLCTDIQRQINELQALELAA